MKKLITDIQLLEHQCSIAQHSSSNNANVIMVEMQLLHEGDCNVLLRTLMDFIKQSNGSCLPFVNVDFILCLDDCVEAQIQFAGVCLDYFYVPSSLVSFALYQLNQVSLLTTGLMLRLLDFVEIPF